MRQRVCWSVALALITACRATPDSRNAAPPAPTEDARQAAPAAAASAVTVLPPGAAVPEPVLAAAQHWQRGGAAGNRILVVTFGTTRCAESSRCGATERKLRFLQDELHKSKGLQNAIGLLTLSVDPAQDVPAVLRAHADRIGADPELWRFAALPHSLVDHVLAQFGATRDAPVTTIVDAEGKLAKIYATADWTAEEIAGDVQSLVLRAEPALLDAYIDAQEALAADNYGAAKRALLRLKAPVREPAVARLVAAAAGAPDLAAMRARFKPLSEALVRLPWPAPYQPMYCPMFDANAGATWVQKSGPVMNPYYGREMLHCGTDLSIGAHADHSPKFGGVLFMAADAFHHVEGTYTADGVFRVRVYDNFKKQMAVRGLSAMVDTPTGGNLRMTTSKDGQTMELRVGALRFPAELTLKLRFDESGDEERFDFVFAAYSPQ